jgi:uracil-DNA glycosylase family protein
MSASPVRGADGTHGAAAWLPPRRTLPALQRAARGCRGCDLWAHATQTVFGEGARHAELFLIGEAPGDREDREGQPFVGPAGRILDQALELAGIDRARAYVTNAVKHFKWEERGKRRIHQRPSRWEIVACGPWLAAELEVVQPEVVVLMGAVAASSLMGPSFKVTRERGRVLEGPSGLPTVATVHPASILRGRPDDRERALAAFAADLRVAAQAVA